MPNQIELRSLRVFICHATEDKTMVHELDRQLKKEKWINLWLAEEKLLPGQDWAHEIPKAVRSSDVVIICLSQKSVKKEGYVQKEIRIALDAAEEKPDETIFIIPVRVDDCKVPNKLSRWQWTEYFGSEKNRKKGIKRLLASLKLRAEALGIRPDIHKEKVQGVLESHPTDPDDLYEQGIAIERLLKKKISLNERKQLKEQLENIKVDRIQSLLSDKPRYVTIAKKEFTLSTLQKVKQNRIGGGQIGGKAAGMLLAWSILKKRIPAKINPFRIPESFYLGSNIMYDFMSYNELIEWLYQPLSQIKTKFPEIQRQFMKGKFPPQILNSLRYRLEQIGSQPLVIRSSSLLEDSFGKSLSGMYETVFCPNQGSIDENLNVVCQSIARIYASYFKPDNLSIPINLGENYLAVLIQLVQGERFDQFYLPHGAGIAFSRNLYRWSPQIRKKDGFVRLVWGLGTRAGERSYDQVFNDYPRLVALSHPLLQPTASTRKIDHYSQHYVDLLDLKENKFKTLPVTDLIRLRYPFLRNIVQVDEGGYLTSLHTNLVNKQHLVITFDEFLNRTAFAEHMRNALKMIEKKYGFTVEIEFSVQIELDVFHPIVQITLLQCRPKTALGHDSVQSLSKIKTNDVVFSTSRMVPSGIINEIRYVLFVPPEEYYSLATPYDRTQLEQAIGSLNKALDGENFVCVGPGRWGTSTSDLGIHIKFGDICNTRALIELSGQGIFSAPEFSFGTHFFQDLLAWRIALLAINLDDKDVIFNRDFFYSTPNCLGKWIPVNNALIKTLRLINVEDYHSNHLLTLAMNGVRDNEQAVAFLVSNDQ